MSNILRLAEMYNLLPSVYSAAFDGQKWVLERSRLRACTDSEIFGRFHKLCAHLGFKMHASRHLAGFSARPGYLLPVSVI